MKRILLPIALAALLGACSSFKSPTSSGPKVVSSDRGSPGLTPEAKPFAPSSPASTTPPRPARIPAYYTAQAPGMRKTIWGELPNYAQNGQYFELNPNAKIQHMWNINGTVALDLLVNRDSVVDAVAVVNSSGSVETDQAAIERFTGARYSLKLTPKIQAPHVVRQVITLKSVVSKESSIPNPGPNYPITSPPPPTVILSPWVAH
jgi:hypothetical protein